MGQQQIDHVSARANKAFSVAPGKRSKQQKEDVQNYIGIFGKEDADRREKFEGKKRKGGRKAKLMSGE